MSSTNKTTNYDLSQYIGSDKPTYLSDYNGDMYKIDAQMKVNADNIATAITGVETATTTANTAISTANSASSTASSAQSTAESASTTASNAQSTANSALATATTAQSTADANTTAITNLSNSVDARFAWTLAGTATGTTPVSLPNDYNEVLVDFNEVGTGKDYTFIFEKTMLGTTARTYLNGGYISASNCSQIGIDASDTQIKIAYAYQNGANDVTSTSTINVFTR